MTFIEVERINIIFHFTFSQRAKSIRSRTTIFYLSFLNHFTPVIDGLYDLETILNLGVFLHHLPEEIILHFSNDTSFFNDL